MRRFLLLLPLLLAACQTAATSGPPTDAPPQSKLKQTILGICGFNATAKTVNDLLVQNSTVSTITEIAAGACEAVKNNPMTEGVRGGRTVPKYRGTPIRGEFVASRRT